MAVPYPCLTSLGSAAIWAPMVVCGESFSVCRAYTLRESPPAREYMISSIDFPAPTSEAPWPRVSP